MFDPVDPGDERPDVQPARLQAEARADAAGVSGKARTPYLLSALAELTDGRSLEANLALLEDNARVAAEVAVALAERGRSEPAAP